MRTDASVTRTSTPRLLVEIGGSEHKDRGAHRSLRGGAAARVDGPGSWSVDPLDSLDQLPHVEHHGDAFASGSVFGLRVSVTTWVGR